ncbi:protein FAR1-RELATED SEQUENCE 9-like [Silene latifolia]|uniref:protein FAR1-RELATED SEQUENCE 9-like n=1 Tax=Silene latifolia TaxID=37657 RepID=UPI003D773B65
MENGQVEDHSQEISMDLAEHDTSNEVEALMMLDNIDEDSIMTEKDELIITEEEGVIADDIDIGGSLVGAKALKWEGLYKLYVQHSKCVGFGPKKWATRTNKVVPPLVTEKYFACSCQGDTNSGKKCKSISEEQSATINERKRKQRTTLITRTGCQAKIRVKFNMEFNIYEVVMHVVAHNHPLTPPEWHHHHRSERAIPPEEGEVIRIMTEARLPPTAQYRYLAAACGGEEYVGHTKKDHLNFVHRLKMKVIARGDAQNVVDMLKKRAAEDPSFFYKIKYDSENRVQNLFWRDAMMKEDYMIYHDVVIFDTTYRTNRYNLICGAFVGVNNHWSNVMFGCAFLSDEKEESFQWLFNTFNESMGGDVFPTSIFTDQDQAMSNAIKEWHIQQNAMSHFGCLKHDTSFQTIFNKCLRGCYNVAEFESTWANMIYDYGLENDEWFQRLYEIREKWSTAYSKDFFSAGILSSQRSESTNHAIGFHANKTTSLTDFFGIYNDTIRRWRSEEEKNEFQCGRSTPSSNMSMVGLVKSASSLYTINLFKRFEEEFVYSLGTNAVLLDNEDTTKVFRVYPLDDPVSHHVVTFDSAINLISCSCRKFDEVGMLCYHSLRVLHLSSVSDVPERYIKKRWSRYAKSEVWERLREQSSSIVPSDDRLSWRREILCNLHTLILQSQGSSEARAFMDQVYTSACAGIRKILEQSRTNQNTNNDSHNSPHKVLDPLRSKTKGRSARLKRPSKSKKTKGRGVTSTTTNSVVPYTPPERLI